MSNILNSISKRLASVKNIPVDFKDVLKIEHKVIRKQRTIRSESLKSNEALEKQDNPQLGLALSGGGIRSASFAMGVIQSLQRSCLFKEIDYLSTVSGGGYTGSAITWFNYMKEKLFKDEKQKKSGNDVVMFGGAETGTRSPDKKKNPNDFLDYIRQHGDYLTPDKELSTLSLAGQVLANSLIAVIVYFSLLLAGMFALVKLDFFEPDIEWITNLMDIPYSFAFNAAMVLLIVSIILALLASAFSLFELADSDTGYQYRMHFQKWYGVLFMWTLILFALFSMEPLRDFLSKIDILESVGKDTAGLVTLLLGVVGAVHEILAMRNAKLGKGAISGVRIWVISLLLIYGLLYATYLLAYNLNEAKRGWEIFFIILAIGLVVGWFTNLNMFGINRMYRDRLMEAFMPDPEQVKKNKWERAKKADQAMVLDMCGKGVFPFDWENEKDIEVDNVATPGPYHLINTNVVLTDSDQSKFRGRGGDNFVISPAFCGGDSILWHKTRDFVDGKMSQATAMAISGAAVNPSAGVGGKGVTRNRLVSFMMAFFHLRLGWWLPNPRKKRFLREPNFIWPGLSQGIFSKKIKEKSPFIELTDGGHFENTGIYELVRRELPIIILSQAGADPHFTLGDIANAIERVKVDFGVTIRFVKDYDLNDIIPNGDESSDPVDKRFNLSKKGFAVARINYPGKDKPGYLIVIKSLMTKDLPLSLFHYKAVNHAFPNQTTTDQFFDENQFEAYRELGYQLTKQLAGEVNNPPKKSTKKITNQVKETKTECISLSKLRNWLDQLE